MLFYILTVVCGVIFLLMFTTFIIKDSSTNNKMTIRDVGTKMNFNGIHLIYAIIALGAFIILLVNIFIIVYQHFKRSIMILKNLLTENLDILLINLTLIEL